MTIEEIIVDDSFLQEFKNINPELMNLLFNFLFTNFFSLTKEMIKKIMNYVIEMPNDNDDDLRKFK